ncbi:hypothetical protein [Streptomyces sp. NPDC059816]|uniref:hypothetical protein n=1 Tax=Streptomyces sp. NPDC059816 TaxID=3346960 RepID=UPI003653C956
METMTTILWPPRSSDASGLLAAYTGVLGWPLLAGRVPVEPRDVPAVHARSRRTPWSTVCGTRFDAMSVPAAAGRGAVLALKRAEEHERDGVVVPCLLAGAKRIFLVAPGTGSAVPGAEVLSGEHLMPVPPTGGLRWETPPWDVCARRPVDLPDGRVLAEHLDLAAGSAIRH